MTNKSSPFHHQQQQQSIWFAYDPQWAATMRARLIGENPPSIDDLWCTETIGAVSTPHIILDKPLGNPLRQMASIHIDGNVGYDPSRPDHQTIDALDNFLRQQCWRSAVDWTTTYLPDHPHAYHIWFIRFACLIKLRLFSNVESEFESFGNLNIYERFPFALRLLHAELPIYMDANRTHDGLDRLFRLLMMCNTILSILPKETGTSLWHTRRLRVLYSITNCYIILKRIDSIVNILEYQIVKSEPIERQSHVYLLLARILLQAGDEYNAQRALDRALVLSSTTLTTEIDQEQIKLTQDLFALFRNEFLNNKNPLTPINNNQTTTTVSVNNHCVVLLYMAQMKEALSIFEKLIREQTIHIHESVIYNMCTIYELESFRFTQKKHDLLDYIAAHVGDGFSMSALKLQATT